MTTPLPIWTLEQVEIQLLRLVKGSDAAMVRHLTNGLRSDLPELSPNQTLTELLSLIVGTLQSARVSPQENDRQEVSLN